MRDYEREQAEWGEIRKRLVHLRLFSDFDHSPLPAISKALDIAETAAAMTSAEKAQDEARAYLLGLMKSETASIAEKCHAAALLLGVKDA